MIDIRWQITDLTLFFAITQGTLPWQPILSLKIGEIGRLTFIRRLGIPKQSGLSQFRFQKVYLR